MSRAFKLSASLVCGNPLNLEKDLEALERGGIDFLHFDVMDGSFVPRFGMYPEQLKAIRSKTSIPVDVHLMVHEPVSYLHAFADAGADIVIVHAEAVRHLHHVVRSIRATGAKTGVALNPATPLSALDYVLEEIDLVMLMAINPGIVGHKLIPSMMKKIADTRAYLARYPHISIEIDGGVSPESAAPMVEAGADMLVCGTSSIFKKDMDLAESVRTFRQYVESGFVNERAAVVV